MAEVSTKPYFIRAIYEWCSDCGYTPYLSVKVDDRTRVPVEYVKNGEIVLNVSLNATRNLTINNELIQFSARFNGVSREVSIPVDASRAFSPARTGRAPSSRWRRRRRSPPPRPRPSGTRIRSRPSRPQGRAKLKLISEHWLRRHSSVGRATAL